MPELRALASEAYYYTIETYQHEQKTRAGLLFYGAPINLRHKRACNLRVAFHWQLTAVVCVHYNSLQIRNAQLRFRSWVVLCGK